MACRRAGRLRLSCCCVALLALLSLVSCASDDLIDHESLPMAGTASSSTQADVKASEKAALKEWAAFMKKEVEDLMGAHPELDRARAVRLAASRAAAVRAKTSAAAVAVDGTMAAATPSQSSSAVVEPGAASTIVYREEPPLDGCNVRSSQQQQVGSDGAFTEWDYGACIATLFHDSKLLASRESAFQEIKIFNTSFFGHLLVIDDALMITDRDEANYHEMIVHTPMAYLPKARRALVIGGGDGGTVTQLIRHTQLEEILWIEIDEVVIQLTRQYFPRLLAAEQDPRVSLLFEDGAHFVRMEVERGGQFDIIIIDSTDFGSAAPLFTPHFYRSCKTLLAQAGGIFVYNVDSPQWHEKWVVRSQQQTSGIFEHAHLYQVYQPTFSSGHYSFMFASDKVHPFRSAPDWPAFSAKQIECKYYTPDVHYAAFVLPAALQQRLGSTLRLSQLLSMPHSIDSEG